MALLDLSLGLKLTTLMNSQTESILFIGHGEWSKKLSKIIVSSESRLKPVVISARNFLSTEEKVLPEGQALEDFNFIWITTYPDMQVKILEKLQDLNSKIILEKPIALTLEDVKQLQSVIPKVKSSVYLSQPWTFSKLWESASAQILRNREDLEIDALRVGELQRERIFPSLDWLPHDLYLLASLMRSKELENESIKLLSSRGSPKEIILDYQIGADLRISLQAGKSETRRAIWCISINGQALLEIDFDSRQIIKKEGNQESTENFDTDNPIISMLEDYGARDSDVNWELILKLYSDGILAVSGDPQ
jgi:predicted dehydrogenase